MADNAVVTSQLSVEENFLLKFQSDHGHHIVDFMKIWYHYDIDKNGYVEATELKGFVADYAMVNGGNPLDEAQLNEKCEKMLELYDKNKDGRIELGELQRIVKKENNFLLQFTEDLTIEEFEKLYSHYDKDKNGVIEGPELIGLLRDLREQAADEENYEAPTTTELEEYSKTIMEMADLDRDGKLQKNEVKLLFLG